MGHQNLVLDAALAYAARGWPLVPGYNVRPDGLCGCLKRGCDAVGKHPRTRHGRNDATTDIDQICSWWSRGWRDSNILLPNGARSGLDILDEDLRHDGTRNRERLEAAYDRLPLTWTVHTGGGGQHRFFKHRFGMGTSIGGIAPGLDVLAGGSNVTLPPSRHRSGRCYEWIIGPDDTPLAEWPDWLVALIPPPRTRPTAPPDPSLFAGADLAVPPGLLRYAERAKREGGRNSGAFWLGCRLVEECGPESALVWPTMKLYGSSCCPAMDEQELWRTWLSACEETTFSPMTPVIITHDLTTGTDTYERATLHSREADGGTLDTVSYDDEVLAWQ